MTMYYSIFFLSMFVSGLFVYIFKYNHFLLMLLSLEFIVLSIYMQLFLYLFYYDGEFLLSMFFLSMSVCESALGLALLVMVMRTHGSDNIMMFDNLW